MKELLKNVLFASIGAAFLTKEKIEEIAADLIEKGKVSQDEGKQFVDELIEKSGEARDQIDMKINTAVAEQIKKLNLATSDEIAGLHRQIEELQALLSKKDNN